MALAWVILMRATRDILDNATVALQVSVVPLLIFQFFGLHWLTRAAVTLDGWLFVPGRFVWWMWALALPGMVLPLLWMAVAWHRFVVLGERPWLVFPRLQWRQMAGYAGKFVPVILMTALIALIFSIGLLLLAMIPVLFASVLNDGRRMEIGWLGEILGAVLTNAFFFRYSGALVGVAVDGPRSLFDAWNRTVPARWAVVWLSLAVLGLGYALERITAFMATSGLVLSGYELVSTWFLTMLNVGLLTTIYAMYVAPPPLPSDAAEGTGGP